MCNYIVSLRPVNYNSRKIGEEKNITKAFMIKFSGDKENNSNKAVNKKYAIIVVTTE